MRFRLSYLLFSGIFIAYGQNTDSLKNVLRTQKDDTSKVRTLVRLIEEEGKRDFAAALLYANEASQLARVIADKTGAMQAEIATGIVYTRFNKFNEALAHYSNALLLAKEIDNKRGMARTYNNMAIIYYDQSNYPQALECNLMALKINEALGYKKGMAKNLVNLGNVYDSQRNPDKALEYYDRALKIFEEAQDLANIASQLGNIGIAYFNKNDYKRALENERRGLQIQRELGDSGGASVTLSTLGNTYKYLKQFDSALICYKEAMQLDEKLHRNNGLAVNTGNLGAMLIEQGKYEEGIRYCKRAIELAAGQSLLDVLSDAHGNMSMAYEKMGDKRSAYVEYKEYVRMRDSIFNEENTKQMVRSEMNFEFQKKEAATKLEQEKKDALAAAEKRRQGIILFSISCLGLLVLAFAVFAYRSFLQKKKANHEITRQKQMIEQKQKEILDSIHYAKRIQSSLMPHDNFIQKELQRMRS